MLANIFTSLFFFSIFSFANPPRSRSRSGSRSGSGSGSGGGRLLLLLQWWWSSDHEAVLLAVVGHEDDVAVGGPDEAGQLQVVLGARRRRLHGGNLVGLDAAQLRSRVQHPDAAQQAGVHLEGQRAQSSSMFLNVPQRFLTFYSISQLVSKLPKVPQCSSVFLSISQGF